MSAYRSVNIEEISNVLQGILWIKVMKQGVKASSEL